MKLILHHFTTKLVIFLFHFILYQRFDNVLAYDEFVCIILLVLYVKVSYRLNQNTRTIRSMSSEN